MRKHWPFIFSGIAAFVGGVAVVISNLSIGQVQKWIILTLWLMMSVGLIAYGMVMNHLEAKKEQRAKEVLPPELLKARSDAQQIFNAFEAMTLKGFSASFFKSHDKDEKS